MNSILDNINVHDLSVQVEIIRNCGILKINLHDVLDHVNNDILIHFELSATSPPKGRRIHGFELCPEGSL
jgi:hypothetical protein